MRARSSLTGFHRAASGVCAAAAVLLGTSVSAATSTPPPTAKISYDTGVLTAWSDDGARSRVAIRDASGSRTFAMADGLSLNGKHLKCTKAPSCSGWPKNVVVGKTRVRVGYYTDPHMKNRRVAQAVTSQGL
jgi:hypothetical protein